MSSSTAANETQNEDAVTETNEEAVAEQAATEDATETTATQEAESEAAATEAAAEKVKAEEAQAGEAQAAGAVEEAAPEAEKDEAKAEEAPTEAAAEGPSADETPAEAQADEPAAEEAKSDEAPAEAQTDEPAAEEAGSDEAPAEAKADEPAAEEAEADEPATEEAKSDEAPAEAQADEPTAAEAKADEPAAEEAKSDDAPAEAKADDAPVEAKADEPAAEEAKSEGDGAEAEKKAAPPMDPEHAAEIDKLKAAMEAKDDVEGKIIGWNKGGYHVALGRVAAFCPVSMIEIGSPRSPKRYLDKTFNFRVIEVQDDGKRIVLSRAAAVKAEREAEAKRVKELLEPGKVMKGRVSSLTEFGAFVDLGGRIEGLVHISELSRRRVEKPDEVVQKGQQVEVQVLKVEKGGKRISLSMKRLEDDPWDGVAERWSKGADFKGTIVRKAEFGIFVEVEPGLEGLVHVSRLPLGKTLESDEIAEGQEVEGWVHEVERKRRRLSLSLRPVAEGNPWDGIQERYPEGELVNGTVERVADFGAFVELEPGLTGLLPFSMLGGVGNPKRQFHPGKEVSVKVLAIDKGRKRISLGTEQSKAEGSTQDYKEYKKQQSSGGGMNALAAALAKVKDQIPTA